jgi:hypothetical protein
MFEFSRDNAQTSSEQSVTLKFSSEFRAKVSGLFGVGCAGRCVSAPTCGTSISAVIVLARMARPSKLRQPQQRFGKRKFVAIYEL